MQKIIKQVQGQIKMNLDYFEDDTKTNHEPPELPIAPMIDIFSMILIFLVLGSVFGSAEIKVPADVKLPKSMSQETPLLAPEVYLSKNRLNADFVGSSLAKAEIMVANSSARAVFKNKIKKYLENTPLEIKTGHKPINLVADSDTPYEVVFAVVRLLREAGFENVLFLSNFD